MDARNESQSQQGYTYTEQVEATDDLDDDAAARRLAAPRGKP